MDMHRSLTMIYDVEDDFEDREFLVDELATSPIKLDISFFDSCAELLDAAHQRSSSIDDLPPVYPAVILLNGFPKYKNIREEVALLKNAIETASTSVVITVCTKMEESYIQEQHLPVSGILIKPIRLAELEAYLTA